MSIVTNRGSGRNGSGPRSRHKAQGLVELALLLPIVLFMLMATVDFARAYSAHIEISNAARAGAIFGSRSTANANDGNAVRAAALADSPQIFGTAPTVASSTSTDADGYEEVSVTVNYTFTVLTGFPGIPSSINMSQTVRMRVVG